MTFPFFDAQLTELNLNQAQQYVLYAYYLHVS